MWNSRLDMFDIRDRPNLVENALLVGAYFRRDDEADAKDLLLELKELVSTLGIGIADAQCWFLCAT